MPTPAEPNNKADVTISPKGTATVSLQHRRGQSAKHQQPEWKRQQAIDERREAEEIEKLATGEFRGSQHVLSSATGKVIPPKHRRHDDEEDDDGGGHDQPGETFQGEWNWDMGAMDRQRATQERHAALLQDVDELGAQLDSLESNIQAVPAVPNLNANDFLDIITGDASEAMQEFNKKSVLIIKKCREIRSGRARAEKELAKKRLLVQKLADAAARLLEAESRSEVDDAADDIARMRELVRDAKRRVDEVGARGCERRFFVRW